MDKGKDLIQFRGTADNPPPDYEFVVPGIAEAIKLNIIIYRSQSEAPRREEVLEQTKKFFKEGFEYLFDVMGGDFPTAKRRTIEFTFGEGHAAQGALIKISYPRIEGTLDDEKAGLLHRSLVVHELIHNFTDDENLPMLFEILFNAEHGNQERLKQMLSFYETKHFPPQYIIGIEDVAKYLGFTSVQEMTKGLESPNIKELRAKAREVLLDYCKAEGLMEEKT